ncbi:hypothetical protein J6590_045907 [Homalodisca vitripennis]|nr:hypothetical protein J6590_045907 [Homalodisca vitripennis]
MPVLKYDNLTINFTWSSPKLSSGRAVASRLRLLYRSITAITTLQSRLWHVNGYQKHIYSARPLQTVKRRKTKFVAQYDS